MVISGKRLRIILIFVATVFSILLFAPNTQAQSLFASPSVISKLDTRDLGEYSQNQILFYDPDQCAKKGNKTCTHDSVFKEELNLEDDMEPTGEVDGSQITFIGDSIVGMAGEEMFNKFFEGADYGPELNNCGAGTSGAGTSYICSGKDVYTSYTTQINPGGISILKEIVEAGKLRPILVFELGGNSPSFRPSELETHFDEILELAGPDTKIVLFTNYWPECFYNKRGQTTRDDYAAHNEFIRKAAKEYDNVYAGDWANAGKDELYNCAVDDMHPTYDKIGSNDWNGFQAFYKFMYDTIASIDSDKCSSGGYLEGNTVEVKVWNRLMDYFNEQNVTGINLSAVISGILGNFILETGIDPFLVANNYYGMHMMVSPFGSTMYQIVNEEIGTDYWHGTGTPGATIDEKLANLNIPESAIEQAIDIEIQIYTANGPMFEKMKSRVSGFDESQWKQFMLGIQEWGVEDTPNGYSDLFLAIMERAPCDSNTPAIARSSIDDPGTLNHMHEINPYNSNYHSNHPCFQAASIRRDHANEMYEKYASQANSSGSSSGGKTQSVNSGGNKYSSSITWDKNGWITGGMEGYSKESPNLELRSGYQEYKSGKPNKILLHYTQGPGIPEIGVYEIDSEDGGRKSDAPHFSIDLLKKEVHQHYPLSQPSGASKDSTDISDVIQIEIAGYGFGNSNPDNPDSNSKCSIGKADYTSSPYCFAHFTDEEWDYLAQLLVAINKWGDENGASIPLSSSVTWTGDVTKVRLSAEEFDATSGIVAHMHGPADDHTDTGNIWPLVKVAIERVGCSYDGNDGEISGAKNADKQATEIGKMWFSDNDTESMKTLLENYGDLAYRTGQAYDIPWIAILVQARYEDGGNPPEIWCGSNDPWGIACCDCPPHFIGPGGGVNYPSLGEGFAGYGKTAHNGNYEEGLKYPDDAKKYIQAIQGTWIGTGIPYNQIEKSIDALEAYIKTPEGQAVVAKFGAANCGSDTDSDTCKKENDTFKGNGDVLETVEYLIELANKNGSTYTWGGGHPMQGSVKEQFDGMLNNSKPLLLDCTGFASLVMYKTYGKETTFASMTIFSDPLYVEVKREDVRPGDIFVYNSPSGHGGIVIEASNGKVTKIAETGGAEGRSGANNNIGYSSGDGSFSISNMNGPNGHFFRWKGDK